MDPEQSDLTQQNATDKKSNDIETSTSSDVATINNTTTIPAVIKTKEEYFDALRQWLQQVQLQQMAYTYFPYYLSSSLQTNPNNMFMPPFPQQYPPFPMMPMLNPQSNFTNAGNVNQRNIDLARPLPMFPNNFFDQNRADNLRQSFQILYQNGGYEYVIAPVWKRFVAESIDVFILFIVKLMIVFMMIDLFNVQIVNLDFDTLKSSLEEDYLKFITFSSDLLLVEVITKIMVCIYEALWTAQGHTTIGGATPGKIIMGLRILYIEALVPIGQINMEQTFNVSTPFRALCFPASNPGFRRALLRAIAKNMLMTLMFPMCFILLFFRNNRTGYDVLTKTVVVEENPVPIRRQI